MKLSYIVPVYNVEDYLDDCIQSLYSQSIPMSDFEVIVINDGSTDGSAEIARQYQMKYNNLKLYNQENSGLSAARNSGIKHASGDYVLNVDSDDYLLPNSILSLLQEAIVNDLDVLRAEYQNSDYQGALIKKKPIKLDRLKYAGKVVDGDVLYEHIFCFEYYSPLLLLKRSFIFEHALYFEDGVYFEDIDFALKLIKSAKRVMYLPVVFYIYRLRDGSITHTFNEKKLKDLVTIILKLDTSLKSDQYSSGVLRVMNENRTRLCSYFFVRYAEFELSNRKLTYLIESLRATIFSLLVSGTMRDRLLAVLFNLFGFQLLRLLSLGIWVKLKLCI